MVRISKLKGALDKGHRANCTEEHFLVQCDKSIQLRVFTLIEKWGEELKG